MKAMAYFLGPSLHMGLNSLPKSLADLEGLDDGDDRKLLRHSE